jgi:CDP-glycerol glycerophosphotransferase
MPAVSVVVICFNDARHLPTAVRSATAQTLRDLEVVVVDDGSDDDTPTVAAALAAADPRVRYHRLEANSGGCSRPRNTGVDLATADYVTFLDSDDALPRRALAALLRAARRTGADVICGRWVRRHHTPTRYIAAHPGLYRRPASVASIAERPEQLFDGIAPAKLYRRAKVLAEGIRFPEGLLYEDLLFTAETYATARGIATITDLVYIYNVRHEAAVPSITLRGEVRNWRDRFEVHRRIDEFMARRRVAQEVVLAQRAKFLDLDLALFLRHLRLSDPATRDQLVSLAGDYCSGVEPHEWGAGSPATRVAAVLAAGGDVGGVLEAADYAVTGGIGADLVDAGGRLMWPGATNNDLLDITDSGLLDARFADTPFLAAVDHAKWDDNTVSFDGRVYDVLGRLGPAQSLRGRLLVRGRLGGMLLTAPLLLTDAGDDVRFSGRIDLTALGRTLGRPTVGHELRLLVDLARGDENVTRPLTARDADLPSDDHVLPTPWRLLVGDRVRLAEVNGRLVLQLTALPRITDGAVAAGSWVRYVAQQTAARLHRP